MKLIISVLAAFTSISNGADCVLNTKLSDTCGSITVSGVENADIDGKYDRIDDCLFQKQDKSSNYISYWAGRYVGTELGDRRCESSSGTYRVIFESEVLDDLIVGEAETFKPTWPSSRTVTVSCDSASTEQAAPVEGLGSLCLTVTSTGTLNSGSGIDIKMSKLAGQYKEISGGIDGFPAYELVQTGTACNAGGDKFGSTLMYVNAFGKYMFVRNTGNPTGTYYFGCDDSTQIANNDVSEGCTGTLGDYFVLSEGSSCTCGRS